MEMKISNLEVCCLAYDKQFDQLKAKIEADPECLKKKDRDGRTILHWACSSGAKDIVQYLLEICNVRPDIPDELGWTPLMIAVSTGHLDIVRMLLKTKRVDVEQSNSSGARPLHYACSKNFNEITQLLLEHDADVNATDKYKQTPLDRCCSKGNTEIVKLLLKHPKIDLSMHKECDGDHSSILLEH
ncbi:hypothetical protein I4U23_008585 [Adineta vaga]|nr:hypothetical protein I4U23_008585 [Adineta vaga]